MTVSSPWKENPEVGENYNINMKKIASGISHLINRITGNITVHAKGSAIKGSYSHGKRDYNKIDFFKDPLDNWLFK